MAHKTQEEIRQALVDALAVIEYNVNGFNHGVRSAYLPVAVELRQLLCDKPPLVNRVFAQPAAYHPVYHDMRHETLPGFNVPFFTGSVIDEDSDIFDFEKPRIPLDDWLAQGIARQPGMLMTIRDLIKSVADKLGAHTDPAWNPALDLARSIQTSKAINLGSGRGFHQPYICAIGAYVVFDTRQQLSRTGYAG